MDTLEKLIEQRKTLQKNIDRWTRIINTDRISIYGDGLSPALFEEQESEIRGMAHQYRQACIDESLELDVKLKAIETLLGGDGDN